VALHHAARMFARLAECRHQASLKQKLKRSVSLIVLGKPTHLEKNWDTYLRIGLTTQITKVEDSSTTNSKKKGKNLLLLGFISLLNGITIQIVQPILTLFFATVGGGGRAESPFK